MTDKNCVIIGASHAGVSLALALRKEGWEGSIQLVGAENELPYHRPPLSKEHLAGGKDLDAIRLRPQKVYDDNAIELLLGKTALGIDTAARKVQLHDGQSLHYDKLALCTGASVRKLPLGKDYDRVLYVRTAADVDSLREYLSPDQQAVVIGGGYIGLEAAAVLRGAGIEVTVLEMADRLLPRVTSGPVADYLTALHESHGVTLRTSTQMIDIRQQSDGNQLLVECSQGEAVAADIVVAGIGVDPNIMLAETAGLKTDNGIVVDQFACTSDPDIYAAGDCTHHPSELYGRHVRLESVQNANDQARTAAANITGKQQVYAAVPWFWSDQYDVKLQMVGLSDSYDEIVVRGDPKAAEASFAVFYLKQGRLIAADCIRRAKEFMLSKKLVAKKAKVDAQVLANDSVDPASWV